MVFGESRRVKYYKVELFKVGSLRLEEGENIGDSAAVGGVRAEVEGDVTVGEVDGFAADVDGFDIVGTSLQGCKGETAGVAEAVEEAVAASQLLDEGAIFALVDEEACLLPFVEVDEQTDAVFGDFMLVGLVTPQVAVGAASGTGGAALIEDGTEPQRGQLRFE